MLLLWWYEVQQRAEFVYNPSIINQMRLLSFRSLSVYVSQV